MSQITRLFIVAVILGLSLGPAPLRANETDDLLQCMADCIIEEGKSEIVTCKQRCARIKIDMNKYKNKDCMAIYKQCKKDCEGDSCKKDCKQDLMNCV